MEELKASIKKARPRLKDNSINLYINSIKKLNQVLENDNLYDIDTLKNKDKVEKFFDGKSDNTIKNYLASFVVLLMIDDKNEKLLEYYRNKMDSLSTKINEFNLTQTKTASQEKNWSTLKELQEVMNTYKKELEDDGLLKKKTQLTKKEFNLMQKWIVGSLYVLDPENNPPLRADFSPMKVIKLSEYNKLNDSEKKKNYLVNKGKIKKFFHLGEFKTAGKFGEKLIPIGKKLNQVLNIWLPHIKDDSLLVDAKEKAMNPNQLSKFVKKVFSPLGKDIGISMVRHIVISELFPPQLQEKQKTADLMLHDPNTQSLYSKK